MKKSLSMLLCFLFLIILGCSTPNPQEQFDAQCQSLFDNSLRMECYVKLGMDPNINCEDITFTQDYDACRLGKMIFSNSCQDIEQLYYNPDVYFNPQSCYSWHGGLVQDEIYCDNAPNSEWRLECLASLYSKGGDPSSCEQLPLETNGRLLRDECLSGFAIKQNSVQACENVKNEQQRDICIMYLAARLSEIEVCEQYGEEKKEICYGWIESANPDPSKCDEIERENDKDSCLERIALITRNSSFCGSIMDDDNERHCYRRIADRVHKSDFCYTFPEQGQPICFATMAVKNGDPELCAKTGDFEDECSRLHASGAFRT